MTTATAGTGALYNRDILRLAVEAAGFPRLAAPDIRIDRRSPLCGSRIVLDLAITDELAVGAVGLAVEACALGQASAALFARHAIGRPLAGLIEVERQFGRWLANAAAPLPDWPDLGLIAAVRDYPARHGSVALPFQAAADAARAITGAS